MLFNAGHYAFAQNRFTDSIMLQLKVAKNDTTRAIIMARICHYYRYTNLDSAFSYGNQALKLAQQIKFLRGESYVLNRLAIINREIGDLPKAMEQALQSLKMSEENNFLVEKSRTQRILGLLYRDLKNYPKALEFSQQSLRNNLQTKDSTGIAYGLITISNYYFEVNQLDSALFYAQLVVKLIRFIPENEPEFLNLMGFIQMKKGNLSIAKKYLLEGIQKCKRNNDFRTASFIHADLSKLYSQNKDIDSAIIHAKLGLQNAEVGPFGVGILRNSTILSELYDSINPREALRYYKIAASAKEGMFGAGNLATIQELVSREEARQRDIETAQNKYQNRLRQYGLLGGLGVIVIIALFLYRNSRQQRKANILLADEKQKVETTLHDLKQTQSQLIQSEKMASLGELTAGIAHEIQNPLNYVNNFSEVNTELIDELTREIETGNLKEVRVLANDIKENKQKINHHGKRADATCKRRSLDQFASTFVDFKK